MYTLFLQRRSRAFRLAYLLHPIVAIVVITVSAPVIVQAQWLNSGSLRNESSFSTPGLSTVPQYHTDMPLDCLVGYIAMDSITHTVDKQYIKNFLRSTSIDTLRLLSRFMYAVVDYNPVLFKRYIVTTRDSARSGSSKYISYPADLYYGLLDDEIISRRLGRFGMDYTMLLAVDYILHVRITDKRTAMDSSSTPRMYVGAACEVLEIFKGQHLPSNCYWPAALGSKNEHAIQSGSDCLKFGYPQDWPTRAGLFLKNVPDTVTGCETIREVQEDEEYIVFLVQGSIDDYTSFLLPENSFERAGGLFRIVNGKVEDPSNFWGLGTQPSLQTFRTNLLQKITDVKTLDSIPVKASLIVVVKKLLR